MIATEGKQRDYLNEWSLCFYGSKNRPVTNKQTSQDWSVCL